MTDGEQRAALAVVRSLGKAGHRVHVASSASSPLAGGSRHAHSEHRVPSPWAEPEGFVAAVADVARQTEARWVVPVTDAAMLALTRHRERLAANVPFPSYERVRAVADKALVLGRALDLGMATPAQVVLRHGSEAAGPQRYPCIVKPSRSVVVEDGQARRCAVKVVMSQADLARQLASIPRHGWPVLLQQRIQGPGIGVFLLRWSGRTVASFAHRRIREKPPSGGVSVYRESIAAPPGLLTQAEALLESFEWHGPAMVEFKVDEATGTPYLMEINGRYWGSLQLAIDAGIDFPRLHLELADGGAVTPAPPYRLGVRSRWELGDLDHLLIRLRHSDEDLGLPPGSPGRFRTMLDVLRPRFSGNRWEVLRWNDPRPFVRELSGWLRGRTT